MKTKFGKKVIRIRDEGNVDYSYQKNTQFD